MLIVVCLVLAQGLSQVLGADHLLFGVILAASATGLSRRHRSAHPRVCAACSVEDGSYRMVACQATERGRFMGAAKKAKHEAKAAKSKTKKDAGKVKHKGKKAKNAAKH